jgi:hypothetical protein
MEKWTLTRAELEVWRDEMIAADQRILDGDLTFGPSDHCKFCVAYPHSRSPKGRPLCPATMQILYPTTSVDEDAMLAED